ncbi:phosphodiester glycosidase family protein [Treponema vincentii]|uniref:phosphodiester glycosidase family protein n=1 Tax=Treponema TaxID=157 RepID=UPI001BAF7199|nr:phosphodiester glycosidase family protein [Treponema vincentii]QUY18424.1 phosphodiester glycosidase family protein [Treponema vincentii]
MLQNYPAFLQSVQARVHYKQKLSEGTLPVFPLLILACCLWCFSGCTTVPTTYTDTPYQPITREEIRWHPLSPGIEAADIHDSQLPLIVHIVKIDLLNPSISVITSEPALFTNNRGRIRGETTRDFASRHNTIVAFNAAPFKTRSLLFSLYRTIVGIHVTDFRRMSMPNERYGALLFYADKTARIIDSQTEDVLSASVRHAVGGFWTILRNGSVLPQKLHRRDSRTAVGLADNGKTLFVVAVEGENKRKSKGLSFEETANLMRELGSDDALQLDGGSSSSLILQENGEQRIVSPTRNLNIHIRTASNIGIVIE